MKITIYELLGMVKDGKAPKKVKYCDEIFTFNNDDCNFLYKYQVGKCQLFGCCRLNDEIEILEEEKKIPEKLEDKARFQYSQIPYWFKDKELIKTINENFEKHQKAIYEIIDYLKSKGE